MPRSFKPRSRRTVALLIETSNAYARGLLEGIVAYVREHDSWSLCLPEMRRGEVPQDWLKSWRGDGIIARVENRTTARAVMGKRVPVIDVSAAQLIPRVPWVETDDDAIAAVAVEHLVQRGFRSFAYCGDARFNWSRWREASFVRQVQALGERCASLQVAATPQSNASWRDEHRRLGSWVRSLVKPVGIMTCYDIMGQRLLDACRDYHIAVPDEAAVLGVDNDRLICELCSPPLSSVVPDTLRTGYAAAELLARALRRERLDTTGNRIPPLGIATRRSTDVLTIDDPAVKRAVGYIREHACNGINAADVVRQTELSRRALEARFVRSLGRTPHDEIVRLRIERVQQLLVETDLTLEVIARRAGFRHVEYLSVAFKRLMGLPPGEFRARHLRGGPARR